VSETALAARGIRKAFPGVVANDRVDFDLAAGEAHALLGQNGAGKTTFVKILGGHWQPDAGGLFVRGKSVSFSSPLDARRCGIAVVHQHFSLAGALSVAENLELASPGGLFSPRRARRRVRELCECYGFDIDPDAPIHTLPTGTQQRVEILKALATRARILLLDEPTLVLTHKEVASFFADLRKLTAGGYAILLITHKFDEALSVSDRVSVIRAGRMVATRPVSEVTREELVRWAVGADLRPPPSHEPSRLGPVVLEANDLTVDGDRKPKACEHVAFDLRQGEILGILGVAGNGQEELADAIVGLRRRRKGVVRLDGVRPPQAKPCWLNRRGLGHIPGDNSGVILAMNVAENLSLKDFRSPPFSRFGILRQAAMHRHARDRMRTYGVRARGPGSPVGQLSGGNRQKLVLARELERDPRVVIAVYPTRGLDVEAAQETRRRLIAAAKQGAAVLWLTTECEEALAANRIAVMYRGRLSRPIPRDQCDPAVLQMRMAGIATSRAR